MKVLKSVLERSLRNRVTIAEIRMSFMPGKRILPNFCHTANSGKFIDKNKRLYYTFADLEKAFHGYVGKLSLQKMGCASSDVYA